MNPGVCYAMEERGKQNKTTTKRHNELVTNNEQEKCEKKRIDMH